MSLLGEWLECHVNDELSNQLEFNLDIDSVIFAGKEVVVSGPPALADLRRSTFMALDKTRRRQRLEAEGHQKQRRQSPRC